jgi:glycosyltransferase involved in cell wall biosynthesis
MPSDNRGVEQRAPSVSVVIPTRDRNKDLERCLVAVSQLQPQPTEVLVVDSAPKGDGAREVAARWHAVYIRETKPGASRARNRGARVACGDIVAFTDDDAAPDVNWLSLILPDFNDAKVALVAGKVIAPTSDPELSRLYELCGFLGQGDDRLIVDRDTPDWFEKVNFLPFGLALNLAIRRSVFQQWRGFDERIGVGTPMPGHEEQHAFLELIDRGFRLVYEPAARVTHPLSARCAEELRTRSLRRMQASSAYLTLLMVEEPKHWREVLRYVIGKFSGSHPKGVRAEDQIPVLRRVLARMQGPGLYFKALSQGRT